MKPDTLPRKLFFAGVVLVLKISCYFIFIYGRQNEGVGPFIKTADHHEFFYPSENFIDYGNYSLAPGGEPYAGRLPGFIFPFILFKALFNTHISYWLTGLFIISMSLFASVKLAQLLSELTGKFVIVVLAVLGLQILPYYWHWDWSLHPASLSVSCLILNIYYFERYQVSRSKSPLLLAGFFLTWLFMLRGFVFLFLPAALLVLLLFMYKKNFSLKNTIVHLSIFFCPFLLAESAWITRNYLSLKKFVPLQTSFVPGHNTNTEYGYYSPTKYSMMKLRELISCWGGDNFWYFKNADMKWFVSAADTVPAARHFKPVVLGSGISAAMLHDLKRDVLRSYADTTLSVAAHDSLENLIVLKSNELAAKFRHTKKTYYYCVAPFNRMGNMLLKNPVQDWPGPSFKEGGLFKKIIKLLSIAFFFTAIVGFVVLLPLKLITVTSNPLLLLLCGYTLSILVTFGMFINTTHFAYFMLGYVAATCFCLLVTKKL